MKKELIFFLALMLSVSMASAISIVSSDPVDNELVKGISTQVFNITANQSIVSCALYINGLGYPGTPTGISCPIMADLSNMTDRSTNDFLWIVDSIAFYPPAGHFHFNVSRDPAKIVGLTASSLTDTSIQLNWNAGEFDVTKYMVFRDGSFLVNSTANSYLDMGLLTGNAYNYSIQAVDIDGNVGQMSNGVIGIATDTTPPSVPIITPPSGTIFNVMNLAINFLFAENVTMKIYSNSVLIKIFNGNSIDWQPTFSSDGAYYFMLEYCDSYSNCASEQYDINIDTVPENLSLSIIGISHFYFGEPQLMALKGYVSTSSLPDYWLVKGSADMSMDIGQYLRVSMPNIACDLQTIPIASTNAKLFCYNDYNPLTQDIVASPTYNIYNIGSTMDFVQDGLNCPDSDVTTDYGYDWVVKITVPAGYQNQVCNDVQLIGNATTTH